MLDPVKRKTYMLDILNFDQALKVWSHKVWSHKLGVKVLNIEHTTNRTVQVKGQNTDNKRKIQH